MTSEHTYIRIHISSVFINFFSTITNIVDSHLIFAISNKKVVFFLFECKGDKLTTYHCYCLIKKYLLCIVLYQNQAF